MTGRLPAIVAALHREARDVLSIELRPEGATSFPPFEAGAHIDLHLTDDLVRSYSLVNSQDERHRYVIAVLKEPSSRGGSRHVHERLRVGTWIWLSPPRNNFPLDESATHTVLIAGGIGITPILCMARRLRKIGRSFETLYFARSAASAAYLDELATLNAPMHCHFDDEQGGHPDLPALLQARSGRPETHFYACGPAPMLDAFSDTCASLGLRNVHLERFSGAQKAASTGAPQTYDVVLARSGRVIQVTPADSLLRTLLAHGVSLDFSCEQGVCGACQVTVLEGTPDHRDSILSAEEQASGKTMLICVSGSLAPRLVLDL